MANKQKKQRQILKPIYFPVLQENNELNYSATRAAYCLKKTVIVYCGPNISGFKYVYCAVLYSTLLHEVHYIAV